MANQDRFKGESKKKASGSIKEKRKQKQEKQASKKG